MTDLDEDVCDVIKVLLEFPRPKLCKHHAALTVLDRLVDEPSEELVKAIVDADDEKALSILKNGEQAL